MLKPRRIIQEVIFDDLGPLSISDLMKMPRAGWEALRAGITDHRSGKPGLIARCLLCQGDVYIRTAKNKPLFAHYAGSNPSCPWFTGDNQKPDNVRAGQYQGRQESEAHRRMCDLIEELAKADSRYVKSAVDAYLPPTKADFGRYPDVLIEWEGVGEFAIEYQMSHTFQTEVSQRCVHYEREGIPLLWVLSSFDTNHIPQAVSDVVHRHRGNAFVMDQQAVQASREAKTLVFNCYLAEGEGYAPPILVRFDALTIPNTKLPYYEDRQASAMLEEVNARRLPYFKALRRWGDRMKNLDIDELEQFPERQRIDRLVAAAFSLVADAAGKPENFASDHPNTAGMMNTYQNSGSLAPYAALLTTLIQNTAAKKVLRSSVGDHLKRSIVGHRKGDIVQVDETSPEWTLLKELFPEALDPFVRRRLSDLAMLPAWAL